MKRRVYFVMVFVILAGVGCYPAARMPEGFSHQIQKQFFDIPIPREYEYLAPYSFTYIAPGSGSLRVAHLVAVGDTRVDEVVGFYERQMQLHDFKLVNKKQFKSVPKVELTFVNDDETEQCIVIVSRDGTTIHIEVNLKPM